jgi:hypothetical protein
MSLRLRHDLNDAVEVRHGQDLLYRYVYEPRTAPDESPKPYLHPLRTLAGEEVTLFRPHDHLWHTGLSMTSAQLSGQNFWGGPSYVRDRGYVNLDNNGRIVHQGWESVACEGDAARIEERLAWISHEDDRWIEEERTIVVAEVDTGRGFWALDLRFQLENVAGRTLSFGSPTTEGRPKAGYGGLFWRGPRSFTGGRILAADGLEGPEVMGESASWLAFTGRHDGSGHSSTVVFMDRPGNPRYPNRWFVRNEPYACASCSFMFEEEYHLEPGETLDLSYRVAFCDGARDREEIEDRFVP